jgi:TPR repeat protein
VECCKWTLLAAAQGHEDAERNLPYLKLEMTSEQIAEAQRLVREFKPLKTPEPGASPSGQQSEADSKLLADVRAKAEKGDAQAQCNLGRCYAKGEGVTKDASEAVKWFRKAAEQNDGKAQNSLGLCYAKGEGVEKDDAEAVKWVRKAAEQNFAEAQCNLGVCYYAGEGITKDYVEAYKWLSLASAQGDENAKGAKSSLAQQMTPEQIAKGSRLARDFKPSRVLESSASAPSR